MVVSNVSGSLDGERGFWAIDSALCLGCPFSQITLVAVFVLTGADL